MLREVKEHQRSQSGIFTVSLCNNIQTLTVQQLLNWKNLIEEIVIFLNSRKIRNKEQDDLLDHFNHVYDQSFNKVNDFNTNLWKMILIITHLQQDMDDTSRCMVGRRSLIMEVLLIMDQYKVEYDNFSDFNCLIKFMYLLKEFTRIELKQLINFIKTDHSQQQELPNAARSVDSFRPKQKRLDTF
ncbi:unnamed protein product [Paramecium octaurelia]|uniref:Uncharacterized protein n=1 Tax=Paramecium octaurelia TaxID=43137 RepID=A0A8S1WGD6_PAROT|nr:unnamed protein product [Paramecium octaurelia]